MADESLNIEEAREEVRRESISGRLDSGSNRSSLSIGSSRNRVSFASAVESKGENNTSRNVMSEV